MATATQHTNFLNGIITFTTVLSQHKLTEKCLFIPAYSPCLNKSKQSVTNLCATYLQLSCECHIYDKHNTKMTVYFFLGLTTYNSRLFLKKSPFQLITSTIIHQHLGKSNHHSISRGNNGWCPSPSQVQYK